MVTVSPPQPHNVGVQHTFVGLTSERCWVKLESRYVCVFVFCFFRNSLHLPPHPPILYHMKLSSLRGVVCGRQPLMRVEGTPVSDGGVAMTLVSIRAEEERKRKRKRKDTDVNKTEETNRAHPPQGFHYVV